MLMYLSDNVEGGETYFPMVTTVKSDALFSFYHLRFMVLLFRFKKMNLLYMGI
jgi:hypothetical protein